jgi:hypothetical protein
MVKRSRSILVGDEELVGPCIPLPRLTNPISSTSTTTTTTSTSTSTTTTANGNIRPRLPSLHEERGHNDDEETEQKEETAGTPAVADQQQEQHLHKEATQGYVPTIHGGVKASTSSSTRSSSTTITSINKKEKVDEATNSRAICNGFVCPLTLEVMVDPVLDGEGNTYERKALLEWLKKYRQSPISRQPLHRRFLVPNIALRDTINDFMGEAWVKKRTAEVDQEYPSFEETASTKDDAKSSTSVLHFTKERLEIDCYLSEIGRQLGKDLHLNDQGICAFTCDGAKIVVEVPPSVGPFVMYSTDFMFFLPNEVKDYLLELNYLQCETRKFSAAREKYA